MVMYQPLTIIIIIIYGRAMISTQKKLTTKTPTCGLHATSFTISHVRVLHTPGAQNEHTSKQEGK